MTDATVHETCPSVCVSVCMSAARVELTIAAHDVARCCCCSGGKRCGMQLGTNRLTRAASVHTGNIC